MRVAMRAVTNKIVHSGRTKHAKPNGTKGAGAIGEDGSILSNVLMTIPTHVGFRVYQYRSLVPSVSVSLTKPPNRRETRKDDDAVISGPEHPATVYASEDKFTEEIRDRDKDVSANEDTCLVCEAMNTRRGL
jgi:hypothetical protein